MGACGLKLCFVLGGGSFACFGLVVPSLMSVLVEEARSRLITQKFNAQQLCNLLWALTVLRQCPLEVPTSALRESLSGRLPIPHVGSFLLRATSQCLTQITS